MSVSFSFALDENSTDIALNDNSVEITDNKEVLQAGDDSVMSLDYSDADTDNVTTVIPGKVTKRYNGAVEYSATFLDNESRPVKNTIVYCGVGSVIYGVNATTDDKGVALFVMPAEKGNIDLVLFNPVSLDMKLDTIKVFDVLSGAKNYNLYFGSGKYYTVRVFDNDGNPVKANQKVTFTVNFKKHVVKTDKKGYAKLKIDFRPGTYLVTAQYKDFLVTNKIIIKPVLIPLTQFGAKKISKTFKYEVKLLSNKGKILKNKKVKVKFNKKTYISKTDKKGVATFTLKTPLKNGKFNVVSSYGKATANSQFIKYSVKV